MTVQTRSTPVAELMTPGVVSCDPGASLAEVASTLARRHVHGLFVLSDSGEPLGVVSDFDLLAGEWLGGNEDRFREILSVTACDLMTSPVETIRAGTASSTAAERMRELRIGRLLVVDEHGAAVGVIAVSDLITPLGRGTPGRRIVSDVMSHAIVTCPPSASVSATARAMTERRSRSAIVVDDDGQAVGVVTGTDLLALYVRGATSQTVSEMMTAPVVTTEPDATLAAAAELMVEREVHRLVVIDGRNARTVPLGLISTADIVAEMAHECSVWQRERP